MSGFGDSIMREMKRTIDVHIKRLRHRLNQLKATIEIQTVRGQGYRVITHV